MQFEPPAPGYSRRLVLRLAATQTGSWLLSHTLERVDRLWLRLTGGKRTLTEALTGLLIIRLTTRGAVSGRPRVHPLIALPDGDRLIVIASNFGSERHPAWYLNLRADPEVTVSLDGASSAFRARHAAEDERDRYWRQAVAMYPGYRDYRHRARGRRIPVVVLEPKGEDILKV